MSREAVARVKRTLNALSLSELVIATEMIGTRYPELLVRGMLRAIGENPNREGLKKTPHRVVRSWQEIYAGYGHKPEDVFTPGSDQGFDAESYDQMIVLRHVPFASTCEHHLLPFTGTAHVAYIPSAEGRLLGVSKLARLVELYARRLQNQERITKQVVDALVSIAEPQGAGVQVVAQHSCMACRGVLKPGSEMVTTALRGVFQYDGVKAEFFSAVKQNGG